MNIVRAALLLSYVIDISDWECRRLHIQIQTEEL
jgi:hypothetical protein